LPLPGLKFICDKEQGKARKKNFKHKTENGRKTPGMNRNGNVLLSAKEMRVVSQTRKA